MMMTGTGGRGVARGRGIGAARISGSTRKGRKSSRRWGRGSRRSVKKLKL